jgi:tetratricopeptide (TPR) repeat protein
LTHFRRTIKRNPDFADAHLDLGRALWNLGRAPEAEDALRRRIAMPPASADAWLALGGVLRDQGKLEAAVSALGEAVRLAPVSPDARYSLGVLLRRLGRQEEADRELELARVQYRERDSLQSALLSTYTAMRHMQNADWEKAAEQLRLTISRSPRFAPAHYQLSLTLRKLGRSEEAAAAMRDAEALDPGLRFCRSSSGIRAWVQRQSASK